MICLEKLHPFVDLNLIKLHMHCVHGRACLHMQHTAISAWTQVNQIQYEEMKRIISQ